ncbi:MAG: S8/S53 family peptidase [Vicingaceae bacterium]
MRKLLLLFVSFLLFVGLSLQAQENEQTATKKLVFKVKREFADKCKAGQIQLGSIQEVLSKQSLQKVGKLFPQHKTEKAANKIDLSTLYQAEFSNESEALFALQQLEKNGAIEYAEFLPQNHLAYTPSDTQNYKQWYLNAIDAFNAWNIETGDTNVVIGIVDTGFDIDHPDLVNSYAYNYNDPINGIDDDNDGFIDNFYGWNTANNNNDVDISFFGHGTNVAGIASASTDNVIGISGCGFNTKLLMVKIEDENTGQLANAYQGMVYAADHGAFVINNSWGSFIYSQFAQDIVNYCAINQGALVIGAVGNNGADTLFYPAAYDNVLSVGSLLPGDTIKESSNYGYYVNLFAPGEDMWTCNAIGGYQYNGGTSMAGPVVAGCAAMVKSHFPNYTAKQVALQLERTADNIESINAPQLSDKLGSGRVNLFRALTESPSGILFENINITDGNDNSFIEGDTLRISGDFTNYLASTSGVTVQLEVQNNVLTPLQTTFNIGILAASSTVNNNSNPFLFVVPNGANFNQRADFLVKITTTSLQSKQHFSTLIKPDYITLNENDLLVTLTSDGGIGYAGENGQLGEGLVYKKGNSLLYEGSFALGFSSTEVADKFRGSGSTPMGDFKREELIVRTYNNQVKAETFTRFSYPQTGASKVNVWHQSFLLDTDSLRSSIIHSYRIKNTSNQLISNLYAGLFMDWDVLNWQTNKVGYDTSRKMGVSYSTDSSLFCGVRTISTINQTHYAIDNTTSGSGGVNLSSDFSDSLKYQVLSTNRDSAGVSSPQGNDIIDVNAVGPISLDVDSSIIVTFVLSVGESLADLQEQADSALSIFQKKLVLSIKEKKSLNHVTQDLLVFPNPAQNLVNFNFYNPQPTPIELSIVNSLGQEVYYQNFGSFNKGKRNLKVNVNSWKTGVYFFTIRGDKLKIQDKFVVSPD